ncbi:hypothetical protein [Pyrobaculum ferrireducens]|uniref:Uncharacterized protein n=1 Tax=Pyrobaculum ferrireducens TaxID=1104324 RepID=G7VH08_9CREN|nr:hypothetical protein [Pyrobaculum ferrireducens]AET33179.1 hypothetical protein P186_1769 [Pyrobaculum ferrireducens]
MVLAFREGGCLLFGAVRLSAEAVYVLEGCALAGWSALAAYLGTALLLPFHPPYLQFVCPSLDTVVERAVKTSLRVWRGRGHVSLGTRLGKEAEVLGGFVTGERFRCGLYVQPCDEAVRHIAAHGPGSKYLKLLPRYVEEGLCLPGQGRSV